MELQFFGLSNFDKYQDSFELNQKIVNDMQLAKSNPSKSTSAQEVLAKTTEKIIRKNF